MRELDSGRTERIPSTQGAEYPFWSTDGRSIGFPADGKLKRVDLATGIGQDICDAPHGRGGSWEIHWETIVFAPDAYGGLRSVSASRGALHALTLESHSNTRILCACRASCLTTITFCTCAFLRMVPVRSRFFSLATHRVTDLIQADAATQSLGLGQLVFVRRGNLFSRQEFDPGAVRLSGSPMQIAAGIRFDPGPKHGNIFGIKGTHCVRAWSRRFVETDAVG